MAIEREARAAGAAGLISGISVVVCCHESAGVIGPTLRALAGQGVPAGSGGEVILVDNNCTDGTADLAREAWARSGGKLPLRVVEERTPGLIHARMRGSAEARHDILFFIDDDNVVAGDALAVLLDLYRRHPQASAIGGRITPLFSGEKPPWFDMVAGSFACTRPGPEVDRPGVRRTMSGAGLSFRTRFLRSVLAPPPPLFLVGRKGEALSRGEDAEICLRLALRGGELRYEPSLRVGHSLRAERLNWDYVLEARRWYGRAEVVLRVYKDLLERATPLGYEARLSRLEASLESLPSDEASVEARFEPGSRPAALRRSFLQGQREGFLELGRDGFEAMRREIMGAFPGRMPEA